MGEFWIRAVSTIAVVGCLAGYNHVLENRQQEETISQLQAELEQAKTETTVSQEEAGTEGSYKDGTYTGEAQGFGGPIDVEVIIEDGGISKVNITSAEKEDGAYLSMAEDIIPKIIEAQSAQVDTISGATFSSTGIRDAVNQALEAAE